MTITTLTAQGLAAPEVAASEAFDAAQDIDQSQRVKPDAKRVTAHIVRVSLSSREGQANGDTWQVLVSDGGRVAAFTSSANNLVPGDVNHAGDVFLRRVATGVTTRITLTPNGHRMTRGASVTDLTPDGRYVLLDVNDRLMAVHPMVLNRATNRASWATGLIFIGARGGGSLASSDDSRIVLNRFEYDLFIVNRELHTSRGAGEARFWAADSELSGDGRTIAYSSQQTRHAQLYVRLWRGGHRILVSRGMNGLPARGISISPSLSKHSGFVAFGSTAPNLKRGDTNGASDVFVRDRVRHRTFMLTRGGNAGVRQQGSFDPSISADGRYVAFTSASGNLSRRDTNGRPDVFVRDRHTGTTCLVSVGLGGASAHGASYRPEISADGRYVAFLSGAPDLVRHDTNRHADGFLARTPSPC